MKFDVYRQLDGMDCGPACLRMVAAHHGREYTLEYLRELCSIGKGGVSMLGISEGAETIGLRSLAVKLPFKTLRDEVPLPCIAHWRQEHFVVVYEIKDGKVWIADPERGKVALSERDFLDGWLSHKPGANENDEGVLLLLEPTPAFHQVADKGEDKDKDQNKRGLSYFYSYLFTHKKLFIQLAIGLFVGMVLELIFPFLTQAVVDYGIGNQDLNFIYVLLAAQLMLSFSSAFVDMIRSWILLHVGSRISISLISDFLNKMLKLPLSFFDTRTSGDIMQRIDDHDRVRRFLTSSSLTAAFSVLTFFVFATVLAFYSLKILLVYLVMAALNVGWLAFFMKRRRVLDFKRFELDGKEQDNLVQMISAAQEIKIQGIEKEKRWEWEAVSARLFKLSMQRLALRQYQQVGSLFIGQLRNILITFLAARAVIQGDMTLGMMLSTQYMIGQLGSPIRQLTGLLHQAQDAKMSLERMQEVYHHKEDEDYTQQKLHHFPAARTLTLQNVSFRYPGAGREDVLRQINLTIPEGKVTAIVGASGSGKTTLLKLLLNLHQPREGAIYLGNSPLNSFDGRGWRARCGVVMQDGYIFSDTIGRNIACSAETPDPARLQGAVQLACLQDYVGKLPLGLETRIGDDGQGISGGQAQRILLARAIYKNPEYLFLDEATSSLDAKNEYAIMHNLGRFMQGRTVVIIAHRLSTVMNADQIAVLDAGQLVELGTHDQLVWHKGTYYDLVRNQLELGAA